MISPLLTDLYQLTMAYGYWKLGIHNREAVFHQFYRNHPFGGNYAVACGLATLVDFLQDWHFSSDDINYLRTLQSPAQTPLFPEDFLTYLQTLRFSCDVAAVPEGELVFANEPMIRIKGPLIQGQLLESTVLNIMNFQTLIATKASRVCQAAKGDSVLEFGLRRAQGPDGALSASRAAYIGGCDATSNVLAGKLYDIPVRGTHAHSWVTAFPDELSAFKAYAEVMPDNCILLVDTYDTLKGVTHAIDIGQQLREKGSKLWGIRLDSGDMVNLSIKARLMLDEAGFPETQIIASNSLDERIITEMKQAGAKISVWGVGTHLVTSYDQPALDGVYKLSALRDEHGKWQYKLKLSEQTIKISNPGIYQVRRYLDQGNRFVKDVMYDVELGIGISKEQSESHDVLMPVFEEGKLVYQQEDIHHLRRRAIQQVNQFTKAHADKVYLVELEKRLSNLKQQLIAQVKNHGK
jgi:nicotinate phosphoribosyltransferase